MTETGLAYYGARYYSPELSVWYGVDPLMEKYPNSSPYVFCAGNPVKYIDPDGKKIQVSEENQEQFRSDLRNVFREKAEMFSFDENGTLQLDTDAKKIIKGMTRDQKKAFSGLEKAMNDKKVTSVVYAEKYELTIDGKKQSVDINEEYGGGVYSLLDNLIVISPKVGTTIVNLTSEEANKSGVFIQDVQQNTTSALFHEIGERNNTSVYRGAVIDYENHVRNSIGLPSRPYDLYHHYRPIPDEIDSNPFVHSPSDFSQNYFK